MDLYEQEPTSLRGTLVRTFFRNEETGFAAGLFRLESGRRIRISGPLAALEEDRPCLLRGRWEEHPRFGRQFAVLACEFERPEGIEAVRAYLSSGLIRGVGKALAGRIVEVLGPEAIERIEADPSVLDRVPGIGRAKARSIVTALREQAALRNLMLFLAGHGLSVGLAPRLVEAYGNQAEARIRADPYRLAEDLAGIGFKKADEIAGKLGILEDAPERIRAGILHALTVTIRREGHCCFPRPGLRDRAAELLGLPGDRIDPILLELEREGRLVTERPPLLPVLAEEDAPLVWPLTLHVAETGLASKIDAHCRAGLDLGIEDPAAALDAWERRSPVELTRDQRRAVLLALTSPLSIWTGGPGVGKTTILKALADIAARGGRRVALAAPTGRAAKRMSEATGRPATTLHRLLEFQPGTNRFLRDRRNPLETDVLLVDETSMLDLALAFRLFDAVPSGTALVLVGDVDQLPSVGPGRVLADLIASGRVPVARLTEIFRQAAGSLIVRNAHRILRGRMPELPAEGQEDSDFYFFERKDPEQALDLLLRLVTERMPAAFGLDPFADVQVLSPMYRGGLGVDRVNAALARRLNPSGAALRLGDRVFREGDKVLQVRNNYELELFNGDPGRIVRVDPEHRTLEVRFDSGFRKIEGPDLEDLVPAYGITVHRAQGSEYPAVVVLLDRGHVSMLNRRLLYTAATRARKLLVLLGSRWALERAISSDEDRRRHSGLGARLSMQVIGDGVHPERVSLPENPDHGKAPRGRSAPEA